MTHPSRRDLMLSAAAAGLAPALGAAAPPPVGDLAGDWDLTDLYPSEAAWAAERAAVLSALPGLSGHKGTLGREASTLKAGFQAISDLRRRVGRLQVYAQLKADADTRAAPNQERRQLATDLDTTLEEATAWVAPEILSLGAARVRQLAGADPALARHRFHLEDILRSAPHTLGAEAEGVLASSTTLLSRPEQLHTQLTASDIPWPEVALSTGKARLNDQGYVAHRGAPDRADRKQVFDAFWGAYGRFKSSLGETLATQVQGDIFTAKTRRHASALQSALFANNVPETVYRTLIAEAHAGLPLLHRYFDVRRRLLGLPDMAYNDIYPPATKIDRRFTLAEARRLTLQAVRPLGEAYVSQMEQATAARWMDAYSRPGKKSGAYMEGGAYDVHPYLLLNHTDAYDGLTTFAHEWGHAMHSLLANKAQPFETADYPIFLAEIASTNNEQLLVHFMIEGATSRAEKLFYLDQLLELLRGTFFRQTMFAEFELAIHERAERGEGLSGETFSRLYLDLLRKYHGDKVIIDPAYAVEWAYIPHFFMNFYVYQYATSVAASAYFSDRLLAGDAGAREIYLDVLRAGGSAYPTDVLKRAGLDMASPAPYRALVAKFGRTLDQIEAVMAQPA